jgi:hypothetical protein
MAVIDTLKLARAQPAEALDQQNHPADGETGTSEAIERSRLAGCGLLFECGERRWGQLYTPQAKAHQAGPGRGKLGNPG